MRAEHRDRWESEIHNRQEPLKKPHDLLRRAVSSEDFVDAAIIGGVSIADILHGKIAERQIPHDVLDAFHAQYPQHGSSFVEAVNHLSGHPAELAGLISGVKGKLFEIDYVQWLNHGHLPNGWTADLAHHANNPAWDIAIHDAHGHINEFLQLKATESLAYVREAIAAHPDIDVVTPHELYQRLADHPDLVGHIVDGHQTLGDLTDHVTNAADHAEAAGNHFHLPFVGPIIAIGFAAAQNRKKYREGKITLEHALRNIGDRALLNLIASSAGWAVSAFAHTTGVGIPVSFGVRLFGGQLLHNRDRRELLTVYVETVVSSRKKLEDHLQRPLLEAAVS
jgi:hypothetical protein